ncbi:putative pectinesterase 15 [Glycine soja]
MFQHNDSITNLHDDVVDELAASIPVVDLSLLTSHDPQIHTKVLYQLGKACAEWGFFMLTNHEIPEKLVEDVKKKSHEFHDFSVEEKKFSDKVPFTPIRKKVVVQANKNYLIIQGQGYLNTTIEWNNTANSTGYTSYSYSFVIFASKFTAYNISFKNMAPPPPPRVVGAQAVALRVTVIKLLSMGVGFMVRRTHSMMIVEDIILKNASSKDPLISY